MTFIPAPLPLYKLIEDATSASLREISHLLPLWFWETDADYVVTYASENIERLTGFSAQDLEGVCILNPTYGRAEAEAGLAEYHDALLHKRPIKSFSYERILLSGERVVLLDSAIPQFDETGAFTGYCGVSFHLSNALDIAGENGSLVGSLKSRAEALEAALSQRNAELAGSNRLLAEILDALGEGLLVTGSMRAEEPAPCVLFHNPAFRSIFGIEEGEIFSGMPTEGLQRLLQQRTQLAPDTLANKIGRLRQGETVEFNLENPSTCIETKGIPRPDGGTVVVFTDVTKLRAREQMLEQARRDAVQATEIKSSFLASMSHEIRTPMNGILGVADLLSETQMTEEQVEYVETIRRSALSLTKLIGDILDFSKIEAGHLNLSDETIHLHGLLQEIRGIMAPMAQAKGLAFAIEPAADLPQHLRGDPQRLRQIMINLLGNAIKFTKTGSVAMILRRNADQGIEIDVTDTGVGISGENLELIFNSFEQVQEGYHRGFEGTGLGLAITRELVEAMGGAITVTSELEMGSTFSISLPFPKAVEATQSVANDLVGPLDLSRCRILLAEDNHTNQFVVRKMLQRLGGTAMIVETGKDALDAVRADEFDLVLMDLSMPVMTGLEATRAIRVLEAEQGRRPCQIVALTGNAFDSDKQNCFEAGMDGFLSKPIRKHDLWRCLHRVLRDRGQP